MYVHTFQNVLMER